MLWLRIQPDTATHAQQVGRVLVLAAVMGVLAGLGAAVFEVAVAVVKTGLLDGLAGYRAPAASGDHPLFGHTETPLRPWVLAFLPALGGLVGGAVVYLLAPNADGSGTDTAIDAYHNRRAVIRTRIPVVKTIASAITLGTGGSAGREGPIALIGAGIGSVLAMFLRLNVRERRMLMVAGMAAGIGAIFRAPLAAALFSAEVLYREMDMEFEVIVPSVISSIVAFSTFTLMFGAEPLFSTPAFRFQDPRELISYTVLALACSASAWLFIRLFGRIQSFFRKLRVPKICKPTLGGLGVGVFAFVAPETIGSGYGFLQTAFESEPQLSLLLLLVFGKMVTTALTVGSGQSGGVFGPSIVIGGAVGGLVAMGCRAVLPETMPPHGAFIMVGMAGFFSAAANTPLSSIIMVSEMTGNYRLIVPTMWVCVISFMLVRKSSLFEGQLAGRSASPVHLGEMMQEVLERLTVKDALQRCAEPLITVHAGTSLAELIERFANSHHSSFPVVDDRGHLVGVVDDAALRQAVAMEGMKSLIVAHDLTETAPTLSEDDSLHEAMNKMVTSGHDELVVVDRTGSRPVGALSRRVLVAAYDHHMTDALKDTTITYKIPFFG
ncbi:MAG: chloride channel protein [Myxococcota bacterium]